MVRLVPMLLLFAVSITDAADRLLSTCEISTEWSGGTIDATVAHDGAGSLRWDHGASSQIRLLAPPADFSTNLSIAFWMHSNVANGQKFMLIINSENAASSGTDYYSREMVADFTGWKYFEIKRAQLSSVREPLGWDQITGFYFTASGWGNTPNPANVVHIDHLRLTGETPTAAGLFNNLTATHPRLIIPTGGFAEVKRHIDADSTLTAWMSSVRNAANRMLTEAVSIYELPDGVRLLSVSRKVVDRVYTLAFSYRMTGDTVYLGRAYRELAAAAAFPNWNPPHFLDVAEMTHAFAIGYDWLYDALTPSQRTVIRDAIVRFGMAPYDSAYQASAWWLSSEYNWNTVCNGGIGMGALAIAEVDTTRYARVVLQTVTSMLDAGSIAMFGPDGAWPEGPGYWGYATQYLSVYTASLQTALDTVFGILSIPGVSVTGDFPTYMAGARNVYFNYADASAGTTRAPWLFWMAREFGNPLYSWYQRRLASPNVLDILWYESNGQSPSQLGLARDKHFRNVEAATMRSSWDDPNMLFAGIKAGNNDVGHSHLDLGTFVIDALGERWAQDLGSDDYNLPGYFSASGWDAQRWTYYRLRAEGHNTLLINPSDSGGQDPYAETTIERFFPADTGDPFAVLDLSDAYDESGATSVKRGLALVRNRTQVLLQDEIVLSRSSDVLWFLHTPAAATASSDGRRVTLTLATKSVVVSLLEPAGARLGVVDALPLTTSPNPTGQKTNGSKLLLRVWATDSLRIVVLVTPIAGGIDSNAIPVPAYRDLDDARWPVATPTSGVVPGRATPQSRHAAVVTRVNGRLRLPSSATGVASLTVLTMAGRVVFRARSRSVQVLEQAANTALSGMLSHGGVLVYRLDVLSGSGQSVRSSGTVAGN